MNGFTRKKVETLTLGERLKKMREERRVSLVELARTTGIQKRYLEALEEGNYRKLPADVYVRGFIRSYTSVFYADVVLFLRLYEREKGVEKSIKGDTVLSTAPFNPFSLNKASIFILTPRFIALAVLGSLFFGGSLYLYYKFRDFVSEPRLTVQEPVSGTSVSFPSIQVRGLTDRDGHVAINGQKILVDENGNFSEEVALRQGTNTIRISATNRFEKESIREVVVNSTYVSGVKKDDFSEKIFKIRTQKEAVELTVKDGEKEVWSGTLDAGSEKILPVKYKVFVSASKGSKVLVSFDGGEEYPLSDSDGIVKDQLVE